MNENYSKYSAIADEFRNAANPCVQKIPRIGHIAETVTQAFEQAMQNQCATGFTLAHCVVVLVPVPNAPQSLPSDAHKFDVPYCALWLDEALATEKPANCIPPIPYGGTVALILRKTELNHPAFK